MCNNKVMIIAPETEIYLLKSPLQVDESQQLDFANVTAQANYFQSLPKLALLRATYQRENQTIAVNFNIEAIRSYNYVMYKNKQYSNKWFYAFITGFEYISNTVTEVAIKTDVFQTYMFDYDIKQSYIKRETVGDDTFGKHILPENVDYGDYILNNTFTSSESLITNSSSYQSKSALIIIQCSEKIGVCHSYVNETVGEEIEDMYIIGGLPQGCWYYMFYNTTEQLNAVRLLKKNLDTLGKGDVIMNIFIAPPQAVDTRFCICMMYDAQGQETQTGFNCYIANGNTYLPKLLFSKTLTVPNKIGTYTPHNNKLFCYPYNYFLVSNNSGGVMDFHYEDFNSAPVFKCIGTLSVGNSFCLLPDNSKKSQNTEYGINTEMLMGTSLPCLSWDSDYYLNWIAQNGSMIRLEGQNMIAESAGNVAGTFMQTSAQTNSDKLALLMAGATAATDLLNINDWIDKTEEKINQAKAVPNSVKGNLGAGDLAFSIYGSVGYKFYNYQIREDMAKKIDKYFDMFGYRVNEIKIPNLNTRRYWNYIQTIGVNLEGNIPQEALSELKAIYNNGITIWHDPTHFLDYSMTNSII